MIQLGLLGHEKNAVVGEYCDRHRIEKVVVINPSQFDVDWSLPAPHEVLHWDESGTGPRNEVVQYKPFYRLCQEVDKRTLLVINECLRTQNRNELTYNCIRQFLLHTNHQIIFQYLPIIDGPEDFMILLDFDTRSQWKRQSYDRALFSRAEIHGRVVRPRFQERRIEVSARTHQKYQREKKRLFDNLGLKDPHTLPRNLYLVGGKEKAQAVQAGVDYIGRNNRFKLPQMHTFKGLDWGEGPQTVFEFCHNHINFIEFLCLTGQAIIPVLTTDLKADQWYLRRYQDWAHTLAQTYRDIEMQPDLSAQDEMMPNTPVQLRLLA